VHLMAQAASDFVGREQAIFHQELADALAAVHLVFQRGVDAASLHEAHVGEQLAEALARAGGARPRDVAVVEHQCALHVVQAREQHSGAPALVEKIQQIAGLHLRQIAREHGAPRLRLLGDEPIALAQNPEELRVWSQQFPAEIL
jgi:hypothetical protein